MLIIGQVSHEFQQCMSSESMPILLHSIIKIEKYMMELEILGKKYHILKPWTDIGVQWATKYYKWMDNTKAHVITMCKSFN